MVTMLVKGTLTEQITKIITKNIEPNFDIAVHTTTKGIFPVELIIIDVCTLTEIEKSEINRVREKYSHVYLIVLINGEDLPTLQQLLVEGIVNDYVTKPFSNEELTHRVIKGITEIREKIADRAIKENLYKKEIMLQTITDHLLDVICQVDQLGNFIYTSASAKEVFGYNLDDLNLKRVVHPEDEVIVISALKSLQEEAKPLKIELRFQTATITYIWVEAVGNPLCDCINGICYGFIFAFRNISERKKREIEISNYMKELENKQIELAAAYNDIKENIDKAQAVQEQFFPAKLPVIETLSMCAFHLPAQYLGGDFYNAIQIDDEHLLFYLTDVSGHALDGAMLNIFIKNTIDQFFMVEPDISRATPKDIVHFVASRYHKESFSDEYFVCILLGIIQIKTMTVTYCNSGFQIPLLLKRPGMSTTQLHIGGLPVTNAIDIELLTFENKVFEMERGSTLVIMTDGIVEQTSPDRTETFGIERVEQILNEISVPEPMFISRKIQDSLYDFTGLRNQYDDDVTYFIIHNRPSDTEEFYYQSGSGIESIPLIRSKVARFLEPLHEDYEEYLIYLHEMITNAIEHGNLFDHNQLVTIRLFVTGTRISATITDDGKGFDWRNRMARPFLIENFEERGRGIMISKMFFDEIIYNELGNQVTFTKSLF
jgi:PAS domain S-box-containing protein